MKRAVALMTRRSARRDLLRRGSPHTGRFGVPIDQWYSDAFLRRQSGIAGYVAGDLVGEVLEVCDPGLAALPARIGSGGRLGPVRRIGLDDLGWARPGGQYDAVVCPLSLQHARDMGACLHTLGQALRPRGVLLATLPCISALTAARHGDEVRCRPTPLGLRRLVESAFPAEAVTVQSFGNLFTATAHLYGLTVADLRRRERELHDPDFPLVIAVRAVRPASGRPAS